MDRCVAPAEERGDQDWERRVWRERMKEWNRITLTKIAAVDGYEWNEEKDEDEEEVKHHVGVQLQ